MRRLDLAENLLTFAHAMRGVAIVIVYGILFKPFWSFCDQEVLPDFGPAISHTIKPINGRRRIRTIQKTFLPVVAVLWNVLTIAQISATSRIKPKIPLTLNPMCFPFAR
jgi:hypothetical protein